MTNTFIEKSYTKCGEKASPRSFYIKSKLSISLGLQSETFQGLFLLYLLLEVYQNILKLRCWPLAFTLYKTFLKKKKSCLHNLPVLFSAWLLTKNIYCGMFY